MMTEQQFSRVKLRLPARNNLPARIAAPGERL
jgi:hypothetical protein